MITRLGGVRRLNSPRSCYALSPTCPIIVFGGKREECSSYCPRAEYVRFTEVWCYLPKYMYSMVARLRLCFVGSKQLAALNRAMLTKRECPLVEGTGIHIRYVSSTRSANACIG